MKKDVQILIDQIQYEWDEIKSSLIQAESQYKTNLENLVLKYASTTKTLTQDCRESWEDLCIITMHDQPKDYLGYKDALEHILSTHISSLEYADEY
jgi:hypothetical protein